MQGLSIWHILVIAVVALVLFGKGKVSSLMGEVGDGIAAFKKGLNKNSDTRSAEASDRLSDKDISRREE
ncbi:MAG: twin-arginine translocase TatA/TatE family subunit [Paracoccaceae bacterium]|nr:twin-arginine translocase TatA/TatE family subunit [Paracoccaceae bacterium]